MPPAAGADLCVRADEAVSVTPLPNAKGASKQRVLIQVFKGPVSRGAAGVLATLATFVDTTTTLEQLRKLLPDLASAHKCDLAGRDWDFVLAAASPASDDAVLYTVPRANEKDELVADFGPVLITQLAPKPKTAQQVLEAFEQGFEVSEVESTDCKGNPISKTVIVLHPSSNRQSFELCVKLKTVLRGESCLYDAEPKLPVSMLFTALATLKRHAEGSSQMKALVDAVEDLKQAEIGKMSRMQEDGSVTFEYLQHLFSNGTKIVTNRRGIDGMLVGGKVESTRYVTTFCGTYLEVSYQVIKSNGKRFFPSKERGMVSAFAGARRVDQLPMRVLSAEEEETLKERGRKFHAFGLGCHYLSYDSNIIKETWCGPHFTKAHGRVMVDVLTFERINPNMRISQQEAEESGTLCLEEEQLYMCWPTLQGFSFAAKKWGEIDVDHCDSIAFDDGAFDSLVLASEKKTLIKSLVDNYQTSFSDLISGKGGGCIFLLHGQPGTGKTLTAEAVSELLHRPLYSVSVGELGTNTTELEKSLQEILEVASAWNAVVLLDEADIFLEKRSENDVARNAMVGIFLRLLEYHQGVLFLTTNRVKSFDSAFHSRISVALKYPDLDVAQRQQVWSNLLQAARIEHLDVAELGKHELNGRQIKTTIRLAQALALHEGCSVEQRHVSSTLAVARQFSDDLISAQDFV